MVSEAVYTIPEISLGTTKVMEPLNRFGNPGELIDKVDGTLLDYDTDFQLLIQA